MRNDQDVVLSQETAIRVGEVKAPIHNQSDRWIKI